MQTPAATEDVNRAGNLQGRPAPSSYLPISPLAPWIRSISQGAVDRGVPTQELQSGMKLGHMDNGQNPAVVG